MSLQLTASPPSSLSLHFTFSARPKLETHLIPQLPFSLITISFTLLYLLFFSKIYTQKGSDFYPNHLSMHHWHLKYLKHSISSINMCYKMTDFCTERWLEMSMNTKIHIIFNNFSWSTMVTILNYTRSII